MAKPFVDQSVTRRTTFDPPESKGKVGSLVLAIIVHLILIAMLAMGLRWKKQTQELAVDAELWSSVATIAAPKVAPPKPPEPPTPQPKVTAPHPTPAPPKITPPMEDDSARQAELVLEQQKKREAELAAKHQLELERKAKLKAQQVAEAKAAEEKKKADQQKAELLKEQQHKAEQLAKAKADKEKADEHARLEKARKQRLSQLTALASADDSESNATSTVSGPGKTNSGRAPKDSGPSAGYAAKVRARVHPNITFLELTSVHGNPAAEVQVTANSDGTITERSLVKSSGMPAWDEAVLRAIDKTQQMPRDVDGRVPSPIIILFRPFD